MIEWINIKDKEPMDMSKILIYYTMFSTKTSHVTINYHWNKNTWRWELIDSFFWAKINEPDLDIIEELITNRYEILDL